MSYVMRQRLLVSALAGVLFGLVALGSPFAVKQLSATPPCSCSANCLFTSCSCSNGEYCVCTCVFGFASCSCQGDPEEPGT